MTVQIELSPETEARLAAEAVARGIALESYIGEILRDHPPATASGRLTVEDIEKMTRELTRGSDKLPILHPEVNDRESYYEDRW